MATQHAEALDEIAHIREDVIHWWVEQGGQPMDEDMLHRYLSASPFFDHTTKNGMYFNQADNNYDPRASTFVSQRSTLEENLRRGLGTEYMIVDEPKPAKDAGNTAPPGTTGVWNIRKQDRQRVQQFDGRMVEELTTLETYYTNGVAMYKAASVADTIGNRLVLAQKHIQAFMGTANALPSFDPALGGYYYLRPSNRPVTSGNNSTSGTPARSRESSLAPGADAHSIRSGSVELGTQGGADPSVAALEDRLLRESLGMSVQFGDEYMDENPIIGEPGKFSFTSSTAAVRKRKADEEAAAAKAKAEKEAKSRAGTPKLEKAPAPPSIMTEAKAVRGEGAKDRRGSKIGEKIRRKKSKGNALSPTTPGAGPSSSSV